MLYHSFEEGIPTSLLSVGSVWSWSGPSGHPLYQPCGSLSSCQGLEKIQAARGCNFAPIFRSLSPDWEKEFLAPSMACSTADTFNTVCRLDHDGKFDEAPQNKKQKVATGLLRDRLYEQDFAGPIFRSDGNRPRKR